MNQMIGDVLMTLMNLSVGEFGKVTSVDKNASLYQRFIDLGIVSNTRIECVLQSAFGKLKAYFIRGALIAIRDEDASFIQIEKEVIASE